MKVAKNISDGIDFGRSLGGGVAYIYIHTSYIYIYIDAYTWWFGSLIRGYRPGTAAGTRATRAMAHAKALKP